MAKEDLINKGDKNIENSSCALLSNKCKKNIQIIFLLILPTKRILLVKNIGQSQNFDQALFGLQIEFVEPRPRNKTRSVGLTHNKIS